MDWQFVDMSVSPVVNIATPTPAGRGSSPMTDAASKNVDAAAAASPQALTTKGGDDARETLVFHENCGRNIVLSRDGRTATRLTGDNRGMYNGMVVSATPLAPNKLYNVRLDRVEKFSSPYNFQIGVATVEPRLATLPVTIPYEWPDGITIFDTYVDDHGRHQDYDVGVGRKLVNLKEKAVLGFLLDEQRHLYLFLNRRHLGLVARNVSQPCYPFYALTGRYLQITALPAERKPDPPLCTLL